MNSGAWIALAVVGVLVLGAVGLLVTSRGRDVRGAGALSRETVQRDRSSAAKAGTDVLAATAADVEAAATAARRGDIVKASNLPPAPWSPPDPDVVGATRRHFLNLSMITLMGTAISGLGAALIAFLWPRDVGGFGSKVNIGKLDDLLAGVDSSDGFYYVPEARTWVTKFPSDSLAKAEAAYAATPSVLSGMKSGIVALYQKCPHLGCRVPECKSSQWFECPCHGSQYNRVGEKKGGPAPRGMDRFGVVITPAGDVVVDTALPINGPAIGVNTTGQEAEGPHCVGAGGGGH